MKQLLASSLTLLLLHAAPALAQRTFSIGLRGGANRATTTLSSGSTGSNGTYEAYSADKSSIYAWQAGAVFEVRFGRLAVQPGLLFSQKGERFATVSDTYYFGHVNATQNATTRYNWLELPVNVAYTLHGDHGLQVFGGPYVALAVGGRQKGYSSGSYPAPSSSGDVVSVEYSVDESVTYGSNTNNSRLDAGLNFGIGYRQGPVQLQLGYGLGLSNLHYYYNGNRAKLAGHNFASDPACNRVVQLTGTYFLAL